VGALLGVADSGLGHWIPHVALSPSQKVHTEEGYSF